VPNRRHGATGAGAHRDPCRGAAFAVGALALFVVYPLAMLLARC
jgi:hypothetical protein